MRLVQDMVAIIQNAQTRRKTYVKFKWSRLCEQILEKLIRDGFFNGMHITSHHIILFLKYTDSMSPLVHDITVISVPGHANVIKLRKLSKIKSSYWLLSTSKYGIITLEEALQLHIGGVLFIAINAR